MVDRPNIRDESLGQRSRSESPEPIDVSDLQARAANVDEGGVEIDPDELPEASGTPPGQDAVQPAYSSAGSAKTPGAEDLTELQLPAADEDVDSGSAALADSVKRPDRRTESTDVTVTLGPDEPLTSVPGRLLHWLEQNRATDMPDNPEQLSLKDRAGRVLSWVSQGVVAVLKYGHPPLAAAITIVEHAAQLWRALEQPDGTLLVQVPLPVDIGPFTISVGTSLAKDQSAGGSPLRFDVAPADGLSGFVDIAVRPGERDQSAAPPHPSSDEPDEPLQEVGTKRPVVKRRDAPADKGEAQQSSATGPGEPESEPWELADVASGQRSDRAEPPRPLIDSPSRAGEAGEAAVDVSAPPAVTSASGNIGALALPASSATAGQAASVALAVACLIGGSLIVVLVAVEPETLDKLSSRSVHIMVDTTAGVISIWLAADGSHRAVLASGELPFPPDDDRSDG